MKLYVGMVEPYTYSQNFVPGSSGLDLSVVSDAEFRIRKPDGSTDTWAGTLSNQTATTLTVTYDLAATPSDIDVAGMWKFYLAMTVPAGEMRTEDWVEQVYREHGT